MPKIPLYTAQTTGSVPDSSTRIHENTGLVAAQQTANQLSKTTSDFATITSKLEEQQADSDFMIMRGQYEASVKNIITELENDPVVLESPGKFVEEFRSRVQIVLPDLVASSKNRIAKDRLREYINAKGPIDQATANAIGTKLFTANENNKLDMLGTSMSQSAAEAPSAEARNLIMKTYEMELDKAVGRKLRAPGQVEIDKHKFRVQTMTNFMQVLRKRDRTELLERELAGEFNIVPEHVRAKILEMAENDQKRINAANDSFVKKATDAAEDELIALANDQKLTKTQEDELLSNNHPLIKATRGREIVNMNRTPIKGDKQSDIVVLSLSDEYSSESISLERIQKYRERANRLSLDIGPNDKMRDFKRMLSLDQEKIESEQRTIASADRATKAALQAKDAADRAARHEVQRQAVDEYDAHMQQMLPQIQKLYGNKFAIERAQIRNRINKGEDPKQVVESYTKKWDKTQAAIPKDTPSDKIQQLLEQLEKGK